MTSTWKIRDSAGWTMLVFGVMAVIFGLLGLIRTEFFLTVLGFPVLDRSARAAGDYTLVFMISSSVASFNVGAYYILAALHDLKPLYRWTVPFRCFTFIVFTTAVITRLAPTRFFLVGAWELAGAIATYLALRAQNHL